MNRRTAANTSLAIGLLLVFLAGCGSSSDEGLRLKDIPHYPNSTQQESMAQSNPWGGLSASLVQLTTTDTHDDVMSFYTAALSQYETEVVTHDTGDGRQTAISIPQKNGTITVAIQEFQRHGPVNITLMRVGS